MVGTYPPNAGGIWGRGRSATEEDYMMINDLANNYYNGRTNVLAATTIPEIQTNHFTNLIRNNSHTHSTQDPLQYQPPLLAPFHHGSPWDEEQALRSFQAQYRQYDRGTRPFTPIRPTSPNLNRAQNRTFPTNSALRASRYSNSTTRMQSFNRGTLTFTSRNRPTNSELIQMATRKSRRDRKKKKDLSIQLNSYHLANEESTALRQVIATSASMQKLNKYGHIPRLKPSHSIRIAMENFNSLCVLSGNEKINELNNICREYTVDILCGCETQIDWRQVPQARKFQNLFGAGTETRSVVAHNINERMRPNQFGGCAMMAFNTISFQVISTGVDTTGLGRWCWMLLGSGRKRTRIITAYQPSNSGRSAGTTVKDQQARYFQSLGDARSPRTIFFEQLVAQLGIWKTSDNDIILLGDFNEHVYNGRLARRLQRPDLNFREMCHRHTGTKLPPTFRSGSNPIDGIFATSGIECVNVTLLPHLGGVGDHRCFIIDFSSESVIGTEFPNIVRVAARKLHCTSKRMIRLYNNELVAKCDEHNMFHRMDEILRLTDYLDEDDFTSLITNLDTEFTEFMLHSENEVSKFMMGHIEWSPKIGIWLSRRWLLKRVQKWMQGAGPPDPRNMFRDCYRMNIPDPRTSTYEAICAQILITNSELARLSKDAPALRQQHLKDLIEEAEGNQEMERAQAITDILRREAQKKTWRKINYSTRPPRGTAPTTIQVETPIETTTYNTEEEIFDHSSHHLSTRFRHAYSAPIYNSHLLQELGPLGDTTVANEILDGTYEYPPDTDTWTRKYFEEAQHTFSLLGDEKIDTTISISDFQSYWQRADEKVSSSFSGCHFGHYKAASFSKDLSALHAAKLTACARKGIVLPRWTVGLTVLLEKTPGNNRIHKMRGIVLVECDFNWYMKVVVARRMLQSAQEKNQVPIECFAKKGSNCINAVMTKIMLCDESRTHHHPACIGGNDFADCYDRIAHPPASIALQSFGVPKPAIRVLLIAMQTMQFFLRTGFGESKRSYGGSIESPTLGLGQGNAAAGPGFLAISSLIVNAYLREGHGVRTQTSLSLRSFVLAAVLYVDDTDNFHMTPHVTASPPELIQHSQKSTNVWGGLAIATGAAMKPEKCFAYFMIYLLTCGRYRLGTIEDLPSATNLIPQDDGIPLPSHMTVPLPNGTNSPIPTLPPTTASLMLGVWFGPASRGAKHIQEMCKKGHKWADCLHSKPLRHADAWTSFSLQLYPGMVWGITTVVLSAREMYLLLKPVYFRCLPFLGVQRHIELPWRTIPEKYQGIGLPNFSLVSLASKLQYIQCIWGFKDAASISLHMGYESFVMDIGVYGNVFDLDYRTYSILATNDTWFKNVWELIHEFEIKATFGTDVQLFPLRKGDKSLMSEFYKYYSGDDLQTLNICRQYKKVIHLSCIILADGRTIDRDCLNTKEGRSEKHKFPLQRPSRSMHALWNEAIRRISSEYYSLSEPLGKYVRPPHRPHKWTTNRKGTTVHFEVTLDDKTFYMVYRNRSEIATRAGRRMTRTMYFAKRPLSRYASIIRLDDDTIALHSWVKKYCPPVPKIKSFMDNIKNDSNQSLWRTLKCDGDGSWISRGLLTGSLLVAHDGSYQKDISSEICSAAVMILCTTTKQTCTCTIAEHSPSASSYRGEILGAIIAQLILRAASIEVIGPFPVLYEDCDNNGVVLHGNKYMNPLPTTQKQADVLRVMKRLIAQHTFTIKFLYVQSHTDDSKKIRDCSTKERMNIIVDHLAKSALTSANSSGTYFDGVFPYEDFTVTMRGVKTTGAVIKALEEHWGRNEAKRFYDFKKIVSANNFDLIWWEGVGKAMASYPKMFRVFVSKQVSGWCGSNSKQSLWDTTISNMCPNCGSAKETSKHLTRCQHPGRVELFQISVKNVITCFEQANADVELITIIEDYLLLQGANNMVNLTPFGSKYMSLSRIQDELGWDCFLEGRIPIELIEIVKTCLPSRCSITKWGISLIKALLGITHQQWLFRNADVHQKVDGLTMHDHDLLNSRINELLKTSPGELLPSHRHLLQQDFLQLGRSDTIQRQIWAASMESALGAASHFHSGHLTPGSLHKFFTKKPRSHNPNDSINQPIRAYQRSHHRNQQPRSPRQQTLPASFFGIQQTSIQQDPPPCTHPTDMTGTRYRLHWRRK